MRVAGWYKSVLVATALISLVGCSSSSSSGSADVINELDIVSAVYDDKGTVDGIDDELYVYLQKDIDDESWPSASLAFNVSAPAIIDDAALLSYSGDSRYKVTVYTPVATDAQLKNFQPDPITISVNRGGFTVYGVDVTPGNTAVVTELQTVVEPADRNFTDNLDGTITDNDLGVTWRKLLEEEDQNWAVANTICEDLNISGYTDWRLPTIYELTHLVDYRAHSPASYADFNLAADASYWSSTVTAKDASKFWKVDFSDGGLWPISTTELRDVRCVRDEPQPKHTFIAGTLDTIQVVYDINNGLIWDDSYTTPSDSDLTWDEANASCTLPWRLPTVSELQSIVDYEKYNPSIDEAFDSDNFNVSVYRYWTSTEDASDINKAWIIDFFEGRPLRENKALPVFKQTFRCVKDTE